MNTTIANNRPNHRVQKFFATPKGYILVALIAMMIIALLSPQEHQGVTNVGAAIVTALLIDVFVGLLQKRKRLFPDGAILTGLIVSLVLSSSVPWYIAALTTAIAIISKHIFKIHRTPIFNPAAFGLLIALLLFSTQQDWWGGLSILPAWYIGFILIAGFLVTGRVNKFPQVLAFIGVYFSLFLLIGIFKIANVGDVFRVPFINSVLFLAFFMITDPPTSPGKYKDQVWFGIIAAVISVVVNTTVGGLSYLLVGLLTANVWNAWNVWRISNARGR